MFGVSAYNSEGPMTLSELARDVEMAMVSEPIQEQFYRAFEAAIQVVRGEGKTIVQVPGSLFDLLREKRDEKSALQLLGLQAVASGWKAAGVQYAVKKSALLFEMRNEEGLPYYYKRA